MLRSGYDGILHLSREIDKLGAVPCYSNEKISILFRMSLRLPQHLRGDGIKLNMKSTKGKVCLDHGR
jgi:hypothetical protein